MNYLTIYFYLFSKKKQKQKKMQEELPPELWVHTLTFVGAKDVLRNVSLVSSYWKTLADYPTLWHTFCEQADIAEGCGGAEITNWKDHFKDSNVCMYLSLS